MERMRLGFSPALLATLALGLAVPASGCIGERRPKSAAGAVRSKPDAAPGKVVAAADVDDSLSKLITGERVAVPYDGDDPAQGAPAPLVTIVEYSDFQCPFCSRLAGTLDLLLEKYPDDVRLVFKQYPLPMHENAEPAAVAALAAHEQGKFWPMHDLLFANQRALSKAELLSYAEQIDLDLETFAERLESDELEARVKADFEEGQRVQVKGTPSYYINGRFFSGAKQLPELEEVVNEEIALGRRLLEAGAKREEIYARILRAAGGAAEPAPAADEEPAPAKEPDFKRGDAMASINYGIPAGEGRPSRGPADALVTIIEFGSLTDERSRQNRRVLRAVRSKHPDVRFVYRHLPGSEPKAGGAARTAMAAAAFGDETFWRMHDKLLAFDGELNQDKVFALVEEVGIDLEKFKEKLRDPDLIKQIREDQVIAETFHGSAQAPLFWVNGRKLEGTPSLADFENLINEERDKATKLMEAQNLAKGPDLYEKMRQTWRGAGMAETALAKAGL